MDSWMESILDTYLYETNSLLDQLDEMLVHAEKNNDFSVEDVNEIFRIMHTIKGSSAMMEFGSLTTISHHIEDLFFYIRDKGIDSLGSDHKKDLFNLMFRSEDYLRNEISKVESNTELSDNVESFGIEIHDFLKKISNYPAGNEISKSVGPKDSEAAAGNALPKDPGAKFFLHIVLDAGVGMENLRAYMIVNSLNECGVEFRYYPEDMDSNPDTCQLILENGFYLALDSELAASQAEDIIKTQNYICSYELITVSGQSDKTPAASAAVNAGEADAAVGLAMDNFDNPASAASPQPSHTPAKQNLISVNLMKLDTLMNIVGEIVITESMVTSAQELQLLPRESFDKFMKSARQLRKLTDDLQDIAMSLRMIPISAVFQKMNRIVRDMKQKLSKDVRLTIIGENTEVDKTIVDSIQDPIMHIIRNCMDHGIEATASERIAAGKNPQGEIILAAYHTSNEVVITISDDGYGMDPDKLLAKAKEKGLLTKPESEYSRKEALALIMYPGFSTNQTVTEFSGRGVGMDVVRRNVESVGGMISLSSEDGKGTTVTLKIPLTLAIVDGMKVIVGKTIFTIPISNIRQSFKVTAGQIIHDEYGNEIVKRMDSFYPIVRLHDFYNLETEVTAIEDGILIWVETNERSCCLFVDDLIGEQQVVVKPVPVFLNSFDLKSFGIIGCTILGDGNISIILDIVSLYAVAVENI